MRRLFCATILSLVVCVPAKAADRMFDLIGGNGKSTMFMDMGTKTMNGSTVTFWTLFVNPPLEIFQGKFDIHYIFSKISLDCDRKIFTTDATIAYSRSDTVLFSNSMPPPFSPIKEATMADTEYKNVCLGHRYNENFKMLPHVKDAVAYGDSIIKSVSDAPSPND